MCEGKLKIYYIGICLDSSCNASWRVLNDKNQVSCKFSPFWYINPHRWCLILPVEKKQTYKAGNSDFTVLNWQHDNEIMKCIFWKMHWCQKCPSFWNWLLSCAFKKDPWIKSFYARFYSILCKGWLGIPNVFFTLIIYSILKVYPLHATTKLWILRRLELD